MKREYSFNAIHADGLDDDIVIWCREWRERGKLYRSFVTSEGEPLRHAATFAYATVNGEKQYATQPDGAAPTDMEDSNPWGTWFPGEEW
jgi:hypothetical protein